MQPYLCTNKAEVGFIFSWLAKSRMLRSGNVGCQLTETSYRSPNKMNKKKELIHVTNNFLPFEATDTGSQLLRFSQLVLVHFTTCGPGLVSDDYKTAWIVCGRYYFFFSLEVVCKVMKNLHYTVFLQFYCMYVMYIIIISSYMKESSLRLLCFQDPVKSHTLLIWAAYSFICTLLRPV